MTVRWTILRLAGVLAIAAAALLPTPLLEAQGTDRGLVVAAWTDAISFHPFKTTDAASASYHRLVYAGGLLERDPGDVERVVGQLAERWMVSDDYLTYTFTLRPNLRWSDGQPLTAADFKWTYDQVVKPENGYPYASNLDAIAAYDAPDPRTVVVRVKDPLVTGLHAADPITPLPRHVWENLDWNDPDRNPEIMAPTVGSGPFRLAEWIPGRRAVFVPNEYYFKGRPRLARYTVAIARPEDNGYQLLRSGLVDWTSIRPADYALAQRLDGATVYEWWPAANSWSYLGFNFRQPLLQDPRVRQALAYAVDRDAVIQQVMYGLARPIYSTYGPSCWCYNPDVPHRDYDPDRARALLDDAGFTPGPDGIRARDGQPLHLRLRYGPASSEVRERIAAMVRDSFREVGVDLEVLGLPWAEHLHALESPPFDWDLNVGGWSGTIEPHGMYHIWSEDGIPALNAGAYSSPRLESLFARGVREFDPAARHDVYHEIQRLLVEDQAAIFLFEGKSYTAISNRIGGIRPSALGISQNIHEWYVK